MVKQAMSAWLLKTRRAPCPHCRRARIFIWQCDYGRANQECTPHSATTLTRLNRAHARKARDEPLSERPSPESLGGGRTTACLRARPTATLRVVPVKEDVGVCQSSWARTGVRGGGRRSVSQQEARGANVRLRFIRHFLGSSHTYLERNVSENPKQKIFLAPAACRCKSQRLRTGDYWKRKLFKLPCWACGNTGHRQVIYAQG